MEEKLKITANIAEIILKQDYLILLAKSYATFGSPAHRLEYNMEQASAGLQIESSYAFLPGLILISFGDPDLHTSDTHIVRVTNDYYMDKLDRCYNISRKVNNAELTVGEAYIELEELINEAPLYPPWAEVSTYAVSSFIICPLVFGGSWEDGVVSGGLGFLVGMMSLLARKIYTYNSVFEITAAILTSLIATALHNRICYVPVMLSSVVILIPGFGVASSVVELAARNIVSGTVRLVYSLFLAFLLAFGMSFGALIYRGFGKLPVEVQVCEPISPYWYFLLFPIVTISFAMIMRAAPRQWPAMVGISGVGFTTYYFISPVVPATVSGVVSAFMLAFTGNSYSRLTGNLGFPAILNGVLILVPGGLGVRGIFEALSDSAEGLALAFEMVTICLSLAVGLFFGSLIVYPIGKRKTVLMTY
ncbi:DUF1212-domain-containing protein [Basidiobolus meristosporus CBS 931.73]|uniref:DUF1212-domain-containing protein n=1 Tax=Basidiobolus meristosporus CBS 931.73 TaxID=1314790 RepID=A0A1Y1YVE8_9FUNG|nr:DUF1212-domain-containing protein [Basidiobolus meristosporus CBS 931.73]|eukprot:ORY02012.1 DUF1212-domain-containing protein [Basidiobolus meristosporus CBS 931.73]